MSERLALVKAFVENPIFLSSVSSWLMAQIIKAAVALLRSHKNTAREILATVAWRTGGMPSSHAALVSAIAASTAIWEGPGSNLFVVSLLYAAIVIRDALGVRRSSGLQARTLNNLGRNLADKSLVDYHPVKEVHGHTPLEVAVGVLLGFFIALAYAYL